MNIKHLLTFSLLIYFLLISYLLYSKSKLHLHSERSIQAPILAYRMANFDTFNLGKIDNTGVPMNLVFYNNPYFLDSQDSLFLFLNDTLVFRDKYSSISNFKIPVTMFSRVVTPHLYLKTEGINYILTVKDWSSFKLKQGDNSIIAFFPMTNKIEEPCFLFSIER